MVVVFIWGCSRRSKEVDVPMAPAWIDQSAPVKASSIPASDYPYLADWVDRHGKPAQDYVIGLFKRHDVVICGEFHNVKEHKDFIIDLIPRLYHEAEVRCIAWEFSRQSDNARLQELVTAPEFDRPAALDFARGQFAHDWNSKEHWDIIEAVWRLNKGLTTHQTPVRLIGIFPDVDMCKVAITLKTKSPESHEFKEIIQLFGHTMDASYAQPIEEEILSKGGKGLAFVGRCHDFTHYEFPPEMNFGRPIMGNLLYKKYGDRVFQVWLGSSFLPPIEKVMALRKHEPVGFDLFDSPFANILSPAGWDAPEVPLSRIARGYVHLASQAHLQKNTPIKGFVTDEMFQKYREYYETDFGRTFANARELDEYLQKHRFPKPNP